MYRSPSISLVLSCILSATAYGATQPTQFNAEFGVGGEYDSNVAVDEVDLSSSQSDYALTLDAKLGVHVEPSEKTELDLSYDYSQSNYKEFSQVDRQTHLLGSNFDLDMGAVDAGVSLFYVHSRLNNKKFLEFYRASPSLSGFLAKKWFGRGAYVYSNKIIENSPGRDAVSHAGEMDLYYFHRGLRSYFNVGYKYKDEGAEEDQYDYKSNNVKIRYVRRFDIGSKTATFEMAFRYEYRDYSSPTPAIDKNREDKRQRWRLDLEIPVTSKSAFQFYGVYGDYNSNLPRADYDQNIIGSRFIYRW